MRLITTFLATFLLVALSACQSADEPDEAAVEEESTSTATPAEPPPRPKVGSCHVMTYAQAMAPTDESKQVPCKKPHTAKTFHVDSLATVVDGHLVAVDSDHAQQQISQKCPEHYARFVGGSEEDRRLSMLSPAWFSPTVEQSDEGQNWYRCDITLVSAPEKLGNLSGGLDGVLGTEQGRNKYGMCSTGEPGTAEFKRVTCSSSHSWRAISTIDVQPAKGGRYPGVQAAQNAGDRCEDAARSRANDALNFTWGYEWPTKQQWKAGRHYGYCWVPDN